jgi:hypothetical protein
MIISASLSSQREGLLKENVAAYMQTYQHSCLDSALKIRKTSSVYRRITDLFVLYISELKKSRRLKKTNHTQKLTFAFPNCMLPAIKAYRFGPGQCGETRRLKGIPYNA